MSFLKVSWSWLIIHYTIQLPTYFLNKSQKMYMDIPSVSTTIWAMKYESIRNIIFHLLFSEYLAFKIHRASCGVLSEFGWGMSSGHPINLY